MSLPANGICFMHEPITYPSATGMTCVTPSPESKTIPVNPAFPYASFTGLIELEKSDKTA